VRTVAEIEAIASGAKPDAGIKTDNFSRYQLPHPETGYTRSWTRVSTLTGTLGSKEGIHKWQNNLIVKGLADRPDLIVKAAQTDAADKKTLALIVQESLDHAGANSRSALGTALHAATEIVDTGGTLDDVPPEYREDVAAYSAALTAHGMTVVPGMVERIVVIPGLDGYGKVSGTAGTFDRIVEHEGVRYVADIKTGSDPMRYGAGAIAMQLSCYRQGLIYDPETQLYAQHDPKVSKDTGVVIHLLPGTGQVTLYWVALDFEAAKLAATAREWNRHKPSISIIPAAPQSWQQKIEGAKNRQELISTRQDAIIEGEWSDSLQITAAARLKELNPELS
jgi:hypothetical protein